MIMKIYIYRLQRPAVPRTRGRRRNLSPGRLIGVLKREYDKVKKSPHR